MIDDAALIAHLREFLPRQRWYAGSEKPATLDFVAVDTLRDTSPALTWALVDDGTSTYQVLLGVREPGAEPEFLRGREDAVVGRLAFGEWEHALVYDATLDPELALVVLGLVGGGSQSAERVRPMGVEQSNTSIVYDDQLALKVFRRVSPGRNLDIEVTEALVNRGFKNVAEPLATWSREGHDLAVLQRYLAGAAEGWALALASLRDLYTTGLAPEDAGGDFAGESCRLGELTAELHLALADAFGVTRPAGPPAWAKSVGAQVRGLGGATAAMAEPFLQRLATLTDGGALIRVHGDFHLGQVVRTDAGWYVLDFEGEPARPLEERRAAASALKDVTGMLRSFHYAAEVARVEHTASEPARPAHDEELTQLGSAWNERNRHAFVEGYLHTEGINDLLPADPASLQLALDALELEKAVYELGYERSHRPDWAGIPEQAISRLLGG